MQQSLSFEMMFVELDAPSAIDATAYTLAGLTRVGEAGGAWALHTPLLDPERPSRFGVEAWPASERALDVAAAWELAHRLAAELAGGRVEPVFAGDVELEPPAELAHESTTSSSVAAPDGWHADMVDARAAWALFDDGTEPGAGVLVGHPDTGYTRHAELGDHAAWEAALLRGINLVERGEPPLDPLESGVLRFPGHGTATGSIIVSDERAAIAGAPAVVGIAPGASLLPIRVARTVVTLGWTSRLASAIEQAADRGCHVISMSLGGLPSSRLARAVRYAHGRGVIVVAAAGNVVQLPVWPANYREVVACAACGPDRAAWAGTSKGPTVDITAPGHLVRVAAWEGGAASTRSSSGTSFAAAIVAGTAALWLSRHGPEALRERYPGSLLPRAFMQLVRETAGPGAHSVWHASWLGAGVLDAGRLVGAALPAPVMLEAAVAAPPPDELAWLLALESSDGPMAETATVQATHLARALGDALHAELVFQLVTDAPLRAALSGSPRADAAVASAPTMRPGMSPRLRSALARAGERE